MFFFLMGGVLVVCAENSHEGRCLSVRGDVLPRWVSAGMNGWWLRKKKKTKKKRKSKAGCKRSTDDDRFLGGCAKKEG